MTNIIKRLPGLVFVTLISFLSMGLNDLLSPIINLEALTIAIVLGMIISNVVKLPGSFSAGIKYALKNILKWGIILLGFKLNFEAIKNLGPKVLVLVLFNMTFVFGLVYLLHKRFGLNSKVAALIGAGTSICGASAVVALAPTIEAEEKDAVLAVSIVSFMGAIGVLIYAVISAISSFSDVQFGIWSGVTLHGVAHALAGAFIRGETSGEIGTFVKMTRVLMLLPVSIILSYVFSGQGQEKKKLSVPPYVLFFILVGVINAFGFVPTVVVNGSKTLSSFFILMAMTAMGLSVDFKDIKNDGLKSVVFGGVIFLIESTLAYVLIMFFFRNI